MERRREREVLMSGKKCARCGKIYPSSYRSCPYCSERRGGRRPPDNPIDRAVEFLREHGERIFLICTTVFLAVAVLGMLLTRRSDPESKPADPPEPPEQQDSVQEPDPPPEPVSLSKSAISLFVGEYETLTSSGGTGDPIWTSSNEAVAGVTGGVVTAKAAGTATITVACGLEKAVCAVTVTEKAPEVEVYLNRTDFTLRSGENEFQMKVKVKETRKDYEGEVKWASADAAVVTVSETGLVQRAGRGSTVISATIGEKVLECIVRVK